MESAAMEKKQTDIERLERLGRWLAALLAVPSIRAGCTRAEDDVEHLEDEAEDGNDETSGGVKAFPQVHHPY